MRIFCYVKCQTAHTELCTCNSLLLLSCSLARRIYSRRVYVEARKAPFPAALDGITDHHLTRERIPQPTRLNGR